MHPLDFLAFAATCRRLRAVALDPPPKLVVRLLRRTYGAQQTTIMRRYAPAASGTPSGSTTASATLSSATTRWCTSSFWCLDMAPTSVVEAADVDGRASYDRDAW